MLLKILSQIFRTFANQECKNTSPLYYQLSHAVAQEEELLELAAHCQKRQPIPNLFFAVIHYLLLQSPREERLAEYYPSISKAASDEIPIELVKDFCKRRRMEIIEVLEHRIVQTNAINRTAYLMPIFSSLFEGQEPINLIDIGTSSGLTMNFDLYAYDYGQNHQIGNGKVKIKSELLEGTLPQFSKIIEIKRKIGIDQNPLDLRKEDNALWLKALIWADNTARFERLEQSIELSLISNMELRKAQTIEAFQSIVEEIPLNEPLAVYHTHVLYQFAEEERTAFRKMLDEIGRKRNLYYLAVEGRSVFDREGLEKGVWVELTSYIEGEKSTKLLAKTDGHATWIQWVL